MVLSCTILTSNNNGNVTVHAIPYVVLRLNYYAPATRICPWIDTREQASGPELESYDRFQKG